MAELPVHLASVALAHASTVTNEELGVGTTDGATGVCVGFDFRDGEGMGDDPTGLVQLLLNEEDVSDSLAWVVTDDIPTSSGTGCYTPPEPIIAGIQNARVRYSDSTGREFVYAWRFSVAE